MAFYQKKSNDVLNELRTNMEKGLSKQEAQKRIEKNGRNVLTPPERESMFSKIIDNLKEPLIVILLIAAIISLALGYQDGEYIDGIGILFAVFLATTIAVVQEGRSDKAFEALSKQSENILVKVIRDGTTMQISKNDITVGDIVILDLGAKIPADGRIIQSVQLKVNESMLTGEAEPVSKIDTPIESNSIPLAERKNMIYSGTLVVEGRGIIVVTSIGDDTEIGKIAKELASEEDSETPLQQKLSDLGKKITIVSTIAAAAIFLFQLYKTFQDPIGGVELFERIKDSFVVSVALIVAAVPEGLPTMVALTLAFNMQKMAKNNALVRKLIACETIGSVNIICSDKTGTLTQNLMTVVDTWGNGKELQLDNLNSNEMLNNFCLNSTADILVEKDGEEFIGNPTECALLVCSKKNNLDYKTIRKRAGEPTHEYHFTSARKMMSTSFKTDTGFRLYSKGSPEKILSLCSKILIDGKIVDLTKEKTSEIESKITNLQKEAKRVLGFAFKDFPNEPSWDDAEDIENQLVFTGFVGIEDPLRPDVKDAIMKCKMAGISVKILTGDNINTATSIANQLGIIKEDSLVYEVTDIEKMSDAELSEKLDKIVVLARSNPSAKMRVVKLLKLKNNSVVVTGDGINDAPALKSADVGVAMGIAGTEVSKEAADIVLLDDSFSTIVKSIKWGRGIYENFQRFIQFQLTVNVVAFGTAFIAEILSGFSMPFTAIQLLWVNIIMDGPPALSLGLEPPRDNLLDRKPVLRNASIVTKDMLFKILTNGIFMVVALLLLMNNLRYEHNILGIDHTDDTLIKTIIFTAFVLFQLWNAFNCREFGTKSIFTSIHRNKPMLLIVALTFFIQVAIIKYGGSVFKTTQLNFDLWVKIIGLTFSIIIFSELLKLVVFTIKPLFGKKEVSKV